MPDNRPIYIDTSDYVLVRKDYLERVVACVARAELKLSQFKEDDWPGNISVDQMKDRIRLLGYVLATEDAL